MNNTRQIFEYGDNKIIEYQLIRSKRVKTSEITVDENKVTVRTPFHKPVLEVEILLKKKKDWILKKQSEFKESGTEIIKPTFDLDSPLPYMGDNIAAKIFYVPKSNKNKISLVDGHFMIYLRNNRRKKEVLRLLYENWINQKAKEIFQKKIGHFSQQLRVYPNKVMAKNLKNRWGSATKTGTINLNVNLVKAPQDIIDYVILHELCHLKIKNHSHHFWRLLGEYVPDYEDKINWLNVNSKSLIS